MAEGLFTPAGFASPEEVRRQIGKTQQQEQLAQDVALAQLPLHARMFTMGQQAGRQLGTAVGGLFGMQAPEDPRVTRARTRQELLKSVDIGDEKSLLDGVKKARDAGDMELAFGYLKQAQALQDRERMERESGSKLSTEEYQRGVYAATIFEKLNPEVADKVPEYITGTARLSYIMDNPDKFKPEEVSAAKAAWSLAEKKGMKRDVKTPEEEAKGTEMSEVAKMRVAEAKTIGEQGLKAEQTYQQLDTLSTLLDEGVKTGKLEDIKIQAEGILSSLGIPAGLVANLGSAETFKSSLNDLVLDKAQSLKGPTSDKDIKFLREAVGTVTNSQQASVLLNKIAKSYAGRAMEKSDFWDNYYSKEKTYSGVNNAWRDYKQNNPLVGRTKDGKRIIFWHEYKDAARRLNPNMSVDDIKREWANAIK